MWRAVFIMFLAMSLVPAGDLCGKVLTGAFDASPGFVACTRFALGAVLMAPFLSARAWQLFLNWRILLRGGLIAAGVLLIQTSLETEPIADAFAAFFIAPILSFALSVPLLGERVSLLQTVLLVVGFLGVLFVVRPGFGGTPGLLWAVLAGCFYAFVLITARWLADQARPIDSLFVQFVTAAIVLLPLGMQNVPDIALPAAALTFGSALGSTLGNLLLLVAYGMASASRMAPLVYFQLVAATALGWMVFEDLPDALALAGMALILGAGVASSTLRR